MLVRMSNVGESNVDGKGIIGGKGYYWRERVLLFPCRWE